MRRKAHVERDLALDLIASADALPSVRVQMPIQELRCPGCGFPVRLPLVARQRDVELVQMILSTAKKYLDDRGVPDKILGEIVEEISKAMTRRGLTIIDGRGDQ